MMISYIGRVGDAERREEVNIIDNASDLPVE